MSRANKMPVNLNLMSFKFPPMAIVSIAHRVSGFILFLMLPWLFYILSQILSDPLHWQALMQLMQSPFIKLLNWILLAAVLFHVIAGIRHLILDLGVGESLQAMRCSAWSVLVLFVLAVIGTGVWLW